MKRKKGWVGTVIILIAIGIIGFSAWNLIGMKGQYDQAEEEYGQLLETVKRQEKEEADEETVREEDKEDAKEGGDAAHNGGGELSVDFEALLNKNEDTVGWVEFGAVAISYPIVQGEDNNTYLDRTFEGQVNQAGCIFIAAENKGDFSDWNTIVYGHNRKDASMFGKLRQYLQQETVDANPYVWIYTPEGSSRYEIFAAYMTEADGDTYQIFPQGAEGFGAYLEKAVSSSEIESDIIPEEGKRVLTFSTCTSNEQHRLVVQAVESEDDK